MSTGRTTVAFLLCLALATLASAQLSGNYTIDPNGSGPRNYTTFVAATVALAAGVNGPVVFQVASTTFQETPTFNAIPGASSTNTITFVATGNAAVLDANSAQDGLTLNPPASHFVFDNLTIRNFSRYGVHLNGSGTSSSPTFCTFRNLTVDAPATSSTSVQAVRNYYGNDIHFEKCTLMGGGYVVYSQQQNRCFFDTCVFDGKNLASQLLSPWNSNDSDNCYINCFMHDCGPSGYGLYVNYSQYGNIFWHNTIIVSSSNAAVLLGSCCAWSRCNSFRNNIVIQQGTGPAMIYGMAGTLEYNDLDHNCYYAPNATAGTVQTEGGLFRGTLAAWKIMYQTPGLSWAPAGGGSSWDQNSIEADPMLVSATAPYDIHLQGVSPCLDAGTTNYIPGAWVSFPPASHPFLPNTVTLDFEGDTRGVIPDIGADEVTIRLVGSGSGLPGTAIAFVLSASSDAGLPYQMGSSLGNGPIPIGTRKLELSVDNLLVASTSGTLPMVFQKYSGLLNAQGQGTAQLAIPNIPALKGIRIYTAFVTLKATAPFGIANISNAFLFTIQ